MKYDFENARFCIFLRFKLLLRTWMQNLWHYIIEFVIYTEFWVKKNFNFFLDITKILISGVYYDADYDFINIFSKNIQTKAV